MSPSDVAPSKRVLVTGATGFIARQIILDLLEAGYTVRGSIRSAKKAQGLRETLQSTLSDPVAITRLEFCELDLEQNLGWDAALTQVDVLMHTASPFPMVQPKDPQKAIRPALEGTRRALEAAARNGVRRVILTSSVVSIAVRERAPGPMAFSETDWSETEGKAATPYALSKTLAERRAWEIAEAEGLQLTTINPSLVLGPPLDGTYGTSIKVIARLMARTDPMLPRLGFSVVDVRDVSAMHLAAMERADSIGRRFIASAGFMWMSDVAQVLDQAFPGRKLQRPVAPDLALRALALFDSSLKGIVPLLGREDRFDTSAAQEVLGITFRDARAATVAAGQRLVDLGRV